LRQALILSIVGISNAQNDNPLIVGLTKEEFAKLQEFTQQLGQEKIKKIANIFLTAQDKIKYSPIPQLPLEIATVEACEII